MFIVRILVLFLIVIITLPLSVDAQTIGLPSLTDVMKKNENINKNNLRKNRIQRWLVTPIVLQDPVLPYHTIKSSQAIILNSYDTVWLWVQEIDLLKWALFASHLSLGGYDDLTGEPLFAKKKLVEVIQSVPLKPFSMINGQFFDPNRKNTPLSFWLKIDGVVRTAWADNRDESKNILIISTGSAQIVPYSWQNLKDADGYFAMVNLSLSESHYKNESLGRTYICLKNPDQNNMSSKILIFTAVSMTESIIEKELIRWWCTKNSSSKLDSSGSTRLWIDGVEPIFGVSRSGNPDYRSIPHLISIYDGK